tara:strand:+ start:545 stop:703 length:159 start_codon:yes stop_codon:yes gene_type:complete
MEEVLRGDSDKIAKERREEIRTEKDMGKLRGNSNKISKSAPLIISFTDRYNI